MSLMPSGIQARFERRGRAVGYPGYAPTTCSQCRSAPYFAAEMPKFAHRDIKQVGELVARHHNAYRSVRSAHRLRRRPAGSDPPQYVVQSPCSDGNLWSTATNAEPSAIAANTQAAGAGQITGRSRARIRFQGTRSMGCDYPRRRQAYRVTGRRGDLVVDEAAGQARLDRRG